MFENFIIKEDESLGFETWSLCPIVKNWRMFEFWREELQLLKLKPTNKKKTNPFSQFWNLDSLVEPTTIQNDVWECFNNSFRNCPAGEPDFTFKITKNHWICCHGLFPNKIILFLVVFRIINTIFATISSSFQPGQIVYGNISNSQTFREYVLRPEFIQGFSNKNLSAFS